MNLNVEDPAERVARAMAAMIRYARVHPDRYLSMVNLTERRADIDAPINAGARHDIERGLASGQFSDISVETGVFMMLSMIASAVDYFSVGRKADAGESVACQMAAMLLRALGVESRRARTTAEVAVADLLAGENGTKVLHLTT